MEVRMVKKSLFTLRKMLLILFIDLLLQIFFVVWYRCSNWINIYGFGNELPIETINYYTKLVCTGNIIVGILYVATAFSIFFWCNFRNLFK